MGHVFFNPDVTVAPAARGKMTATAMQANGVFRLPTDPLYYFTLTLSNIVVGSRYRVTRDDTGAELATGIASNTTEVIAGIPAFSSNMLMNITIRNASGSPAYRIFDTAAYAAREGTFVYVLQQLDE